jgi:hypothetical protein
MIVSWLRDISYLFQLSPGAFVSIELKSMRILVVVLDPSEDNHIVSEHCCSVVGDFAWTCSFEANWFPRCSTFRVSLKVIDTGDAESPHACHRTLFDIPSSMDIKTIITKKDLLIINDEAAVIGSSLRKFAGKSNFAP